MVSISSTALSISLKDVEWHNREYSGALPNNFEGNFILIYQNKIYIEEYITVGELTLQIKEWFSKDGLNNHDDFNYTSLDTEDNPIISLKYNDLKKLWMLESYLMRESDILYIESDEIEREFKSLIDSFDSEIFSRFGRVSIKW